MSKREKSENKDKREEASAQRSGCLTFASFCSTLYQKAEKNNSLVMSGQEGDEDELGKVSPIVLLHFKKTMNLPEERRPHQHLLPHASDEDEF